MQRPLTGARALSCRCASFRAFRFTRRCQGDYPGRFASWAAPTWARVGARDSPAQRETPPGSGAGVEGRKIWHKRQVSVSGKQRRGDSMSTRRPRAPSSPRDSPVKNRGFLGGEILRAVRRPLAIRSDNFIPLSVFLGTFCTSKKYPSGGRLLHVPPGLPAEKASIPIENRNIIIKLYRKESKLL